MGILDWLFWIVCLLALVLFVAQFIHVGGNDVE